MNKRVRLTKYANENSKRGERKPVKVNEMKLIVELMKNSRRSDRGLATAIRVSQPTVSRMIKRLEKDGYIREYTMIPDFQKLGCELVALTFLKLKRNLNAEEAQKARETTRERLKESTFPIVMLERGIGLGYDGVLISLYEDYSSYSEHMNLLRTYPFLELAHIESFIISLNDKTSYRPLTLASIAENLLKMKKSVGIKQ
jgi:DNA-binding Lrp family transcriptional regulator